MNYAGNDTYAHSTLGVLVPQPDGSYRTKNETFTQLAPRAPNGLNLLSFRGLRRAVVRSPDRFEVLHCSCAA